MNLTEALLRYLADEGPSSTSLLAAHLTCPPEDLAAGLQALQQQGQIRAQPYRYHPEPLSLWDLSAAAARRLGAGRRRRLSPLRLDHHLGLQNLRLAASRHGYQDWRGARYCHAQSLLQPELWQKIPDALLTCPRGRRLALELELFIKASWRYQQACDAYAELLYAKVIDAVVYITPMILQKRLQMRLHNVDELHLQGYSILFPETLRRRFEVHALESWPVHS